MFLIVYGTNYTVSQQLNTTLCAFFPVFSIHTRTPAGFLLVLINIDMFKNV